MKNIALVPLIIVIVCILMTGCVGQMKNTTVNVPTVTPSNTFAPFSNVTNETNTTVTTGFRGPLRVTIGGWDADLPVSIDNKSFGIVTKDKPLDLMLDEGNHTVKVCAGTKCKEEVVTIRFAKQQVADFEEWLFKDVEFAKPTVRIVGYYTSGDEITITLEYINPSLKDISMSAEVRCGYTYIESRSNNRVGGVAQGIVNANVKSDNRVMQTVDLGLASGYSYVYSIPVISNIKIK